MTIHTWNVNKWNNTYIPEGIINYKKYNVNKDKWYNSLDIKIRMQTNIIKITGEKNCGRTSYVLQLFFFLYRYIPINNQWNKYETIT